MNILVEGSPVEWDENLPVERKEVSVASDKDSTIASGITHLFNKDVILAGKHRIQWFSKLVSSSQMADLR